MPGPVELDLPGFTKEEVNPSSIDKDRIFSVEAKQPEARRGRRRATLRAAKSAIKPPPPPRGRRREAGRQPSRTESFSVTLPKVTPDSQIERRIELQLTFHGLIFEIDRC